MSIFIFIDDERMPDDVTWLKLPKPDHWHVCRSYKGFLKLLASLKEPPAFVSFDHDLGIKEGEEERNGNHCAKALVMECFDNYWKLPGYRVHSQNPVGKENIIATLEQGERWIKQRK
jgi:hypothetical protein